MIIDEASRVSYYPLKSSYLQDGKFFVSIDGRLLLLEFDKLKVKTMKDGPPIQLVVYDSRDYEPVDFRSLVHLEQFCRDNKIQLLDERTAEVIIAISAIRKSKQDSNDKSVNVSEIFDFLLVGLDPASDVYMQRRDEIARAYDNLQLPVLVGDLSGVASWLKKRVYHNSINIDSVVNSLTHNNWKIKKISNPAKTPTKFILMFIGIIGSLIAVAVAAAILSLPSPDISDEILNAIDVEIARSENTPSQNSFNDLLQLP